MKILFVTDRPAWPAVDGGRQRTALLLRALQEVGQVETVLLFDPAGNDISDWPALRKKMRCILHVTPCNRGELGFWKFFRWINPGLVDRIAHNFGALQVEYLPDPKVSAQLDALIRDNKYDVIVGRYLRPTAYSGSLGYAPLALDVDDLDTQAYRSRLQVPGQPLWKKWIIKRHLNQLEKIVPASIDNLAHLWVAADEDKDKIRNPRISVLRNIPYADRYENDVDIPAADFSECMVVLMVASMTHRVNVEGVETFLRKCWPVVHAQCPSATFKIIGAGMTVRQITEWGQIRGVIPLGFVSELAPFYKEAALAIVPLFEGGGTKIKVLEALRFRRLAVVTRHAHRGYEQTLPADLTVVVAESPLELAEKIVEQLRRPAERQARATAGWHRVNEHYSWTSFRKVVAEGVRCAMENRSEGVARVKSLY